MYVCMCVCVLLASSLLFKHVLLNNKGTFCQYNCIKILSSFLASLGFYVGIGKWRLTMHLNDSTFIV